MGIRASCSVYVNLYYNIVHGIPPLDPLLVKEGKEGRL